VFRFNTLIDVVLLYIYIDVASKVFLSVLINDNILYILAAIVAYYKVIVVSTKNLILNYSKVRNKDLTIVLKEAINIKRILSELLI
jgi:hypothetical protein